MSLTSGTRLGAYDVIGLIGQGGMGEVYRARDTKLRRGERHLPWVLVLTNRSSEPLRT